MYYTDSYRALFQRTLNVINNQVAAGNWFIMVGVVNGASSVLRVNGVEVAGNCGTQAAASALRLGNGWLGRYCEQVFWDGAFDLTTRASVEANAKAYWNPAMW
jgi:hypothetical protein